MNSPRRGDQPLRSLAVDAQEHLLWVVTSGKLQKLSLDIFHQTIKTVWPTSENPVNIEGIPVQGTQVAVDGKTLYLTLMSPDGRSYSLTAVDAERGKTKWRRELGHSLFGDPIVQGDAVHLIDHSGQIWRIKPSSQDTLADRFTAMPAPVAKGFASISKVASLWYFLGSTSHPSHVAAALDDGHQLALMDLTSERDPKQQPWKWKIFSMRARVAGQPCMVDGHIAVPCDDGLIQLLEWKSNPRPNPLPTYPWRVASGPAGEAPILCSAGEHAIVLIDNQSGVRRLELQSAGQDLSRWTEVGSLFSVPNAHMLPPVAAGEFVYLADRGGTLHGVQFTKGDADRWQCDLPGEPSCAPFCTGAP